MPKVTTREGEIGAVSYARLSPDVRRSRASGSRKHHRREPKPRPLCTRLPKDTRNNQTIGDSGVTREAVN